MNIPNNADIKDFLKCPTYPDLMPITYKMCVSRSLTMTPGGGYLYPECVECETGEIVRNHFKDFKLENKKQSNFTTTAKSLKSLKIHKKKEKKVYTNNMLQSQVEYLYDLVQKKQFIKAITLIKLLASELSLYG
jgi:hypothetical protein